MPHVSQTPLPKLKSQAVTPSATNTEDLEILEKLSQSNFKVYLVQDQQEGTRYALKLFPFESSCTKPSTAYIQEKRFDSLHHNHII